MFNSTVLLVYVTATWILCLAVAAGLTTYLYDRWVVNLDDLKDRWLAIQLSNLITDGLGITLLMESTWLLGSVGYLTLLDLGVGASVLVVSVFLITNIMGSRKFKKDYRQNLQTKS